MPYLKIDILIMVLDNLNGLFYFDLASCIVELIRRISTQYFISTQYYVNM